MNTPHKHADIIHAWADGAKIQYLAQDGLTWIDTDRPGWCERDTYRIKPSVEIPEGFTAYTKDARFAADANNIKGYEFLMSDGSKTFFALGHGMPHRQRDIIAYRPVPKIPEGFTPFDGGECPVDSNAIVQIILRQGSFNTDKACFFAWSHGENDFDIIAYRVVKKAPVVRWQWICKRHDGTVYVTSDLDTEKDIREWALKNGFDVIGKAEWTRTELDE